MSLLLHNKIFISTRPEGQSGELEQLFSKVGATLIEMPLIKIQPARLTDEEQKCFKQLHHFKWLIFTSINGVHYFFENLNEIQGNQHLPESLQLAVIGNKTEKVLNSFGYKASFINPGSTGEDFAGAFGQILKHENQKPSVLLALGNLARTVIQDQISEVALCTRINLYQTESPESLDEKVMQLILNDNYEMLIFTSPSGVKNFLKLAGKIQPEKIRMACIGDTTSKTAFENNIIPRVVAENSSAAGLFESILNCYK
jgi:uroporphyrinogen-III synthase